MGEQQNFAVSSLEFCSPASLRNSPLLLHDIREVSLYSALCSIPL